MTETRYDNIGAVLEFYLGPAAPRFIGCQIKFHLHKTPQEATTDDMQPLTKWVRVALALLAEDRPTVDECARRLTQLV